MQLSGVCIQRSTMGPMAVPRTAMIAPSTSDRAMPVCRALEMPFRFSAPQNWDRITVAPELMPMKKPLTMLTRGPVEPTAASAVVPTTRPTMMVSTVLYICWKKVPSRMGKKKISSCFQILPSVIWRCFADELIVSRLSAGITAICRTAD